MKSLNMHKPKFELSIQVICMFMKCLNMHKKQGFEHRIYILNRQSTNLAELLPRPQHNSNKSGL